MGNYHDDVPELAIFFSREGVDIPPSFHIGIFDLFHAMIRFYHMDEKTRAALPAESSWPTSRVKGELAMLGLTEADFVALAKLTEPVARRHGQDRETIPERNGFIHIKLDQNFMV